MECLCFSIGRRLARAAAMRSLSVLPVVTGVLGLVGLAGCAAERDSFEPMEPGTVARGEARGQPHGDVHCAADEGGNLHVHAPADARVTADTSTGDAAVTIEYGSADASGYQMPRPRRPMSRSLGFIGDAPLTQAPNRGGRWSYGAHDDLLPPHAHHAGPAGWTGRSSFGRGWGYRSYGYGFR